MAIRVSLAGGPKGVPVEFIAAIAGGLTVDAAAEKVGKSQRTAYRWLADPAVRAAVIRQRAEYVSTAMGSLCGDMAAAVRKLVKLMDDPSPHVQLQAARSVLTIGLEFKQAVDMETRLAEIERRLQLRDVLNAEGQ